MIIFSARVQDRPVCTVSCYGVMSMCIVLYNFNPHSSEQRSYINLTFLQFILNFTHFQKISESTLIDFYTLYKFKKKLYAGNSDIKLILNYLKEIKNIYTMYT